MPGNLSKKTVPASGTGKRNVPAGDFELLLGARAKSPIDPGEPVLWTDVEEPFEADAFSKTVPKGRRALTVSVDMTSSFSGLLQPGDRVDLLAKGPEDKTGAWIRNIPVIAVDRNVNRLARPTDAAETGTVTLMVTPDEGVAIAKRIGGRQAVLVPAESRRQHRRAHRSRRRPSRRLPGGSMERRRPGSAVRHSAGGAAS